MARRRKNSELELIQLIGGGILVFCLLVYSRDPNWGRSVIRSLPKIITISAAAIVGFSLLVVVIRKLRGTASTSGSGAEPSRIDVALPTLEIASPPRTPAFVNPSQIRSDTLDAEITAMDWFQFEKLVELVYTALGFRVERRGAANPDNGIDLILHGSTERVGVQCKHWKARDAGVRQVRELLGAMQDEKLNAAIFVCSGTFTTDARELARRNGIELVEKADLLRLIAKSGVRFSPAYADLRRADRKTCPKCEREMVLRTAKSGPVAGSKFWGCSTYPKCRYTLQLES